MKIKSVPEMSYTVNDKDAQGNSLIRGEIYFRGVSNFKYYYKVEDMSGTLDEEGWVHTGDIVAMRENGSVKIIDRIKNIFKLS